MRRWLVLVAILVVMGAVALWAVRVTKPEAPRAR